MPTKLVIPPDQSGYAVEDGHEVLSVQLDGGAARYRRDIIGANSIVNVSWTVKPEYYEYLRAFFKTTVKNGSLPFLIDLILDSPNLTEHTAYFIPGTMKLMSQRGQEYVVTAQLDVKIIPPDDVANAAIVDAINNP